MFESFFALIWSLLGFDFTHATTSCNHGSGGPTPGTGIGHPTLIP